MIHYTFFEYSYRQTVHIPLKLRLTLYVTSSPVPRNYGIHQPTEYTRLTSTTASSWRTSRIFANRFFRLAMACKSDARRGARRVISWPYLETPAASTQEIRASLDRRKQRKYRKDAEELDRMHKENPNPANCLEKWTPIHLLRAAAARGSWQATVAINTSALAIWATPSCVRSPRARRAT
jgi:hypothetical protein